MHQHFLNRNFLRNIKKSSFLSQGLLPPRLAEFLYIVIKLIKIIFYCNLRLFYFCHIQLYSLLFIAILFGCRSISIIQFCSTCWTAKIHFRWAIRTIQVVIQAALGFRKHFSCLIFCIKLFSAYVWSSLCLWKNSGKRYCIDTVYQL